MPSRPPQSRRPFPPKSFQKELPAEGKFIARGVRIIHEDDDVLIVEKPTGLVTADPARAENAAASARPSARVGQTLFDLVKKYLRTSGKKPRRPSRQKGSGELDARGPRSGRVWIIHRLDKEASGLLVFAKSERAFTRLKDEFKTKKVHRIYLAVAEGKLGEVGGTGSRQSLIHEDRGPRRSPVEAAEDHAPFYEKKMAVTHYRVMGQGQDRTLLQVRLDTGRKNQIRIHMQELGHPLVGDARFGATTNPIGRLGLHAAELGFTHPATNQTVRYNSPVPPAFYRCVGMTPPGASAAMGAETGAAGRSEAAAGTSWNEVAEWYDQLLEGKGNDHYQQVILPGTIRLLQPVRGRKILDVACGQGILARGLAEQGARVTGIDAAPKLIEAARARSPEIEFHTADARDFSALNLGGYDAAACVMALTNIDPIEPAFAGIARALKPGGVCVCVLSHPAFRVPGESSWGWDDERKRQYRRVESYLSSTRRQLQMRPGEAASGGAGALTWTFHRPLSAYVGALAQAGLLVDAIEEWPSQRAATSGPRAPEENRARLEIPLFVAIRGMKIEK